VDTLWSSPFLKSPQVDMGYDVSDYKDVDPSCGTLEDVDSLLAMLKKRGMR
jgi:oligo-1,6-glucosidase